MHWFLSSQSAKPEGLHCPPLQASPLVQALASLQGVVSAMVPVAHLPVLASHAVFLQPLSSVVSQVTMVLLSGTHLYGNLLVSQINLPRHRFGLAWASQSA